MMEDIIFVVVKNAPLDLDEVAQFLKAVQDGTSVVVLVQEEVYGLYGVLYQFLFQQGNILGTFVFNKVEDILKPEFKENLEDQIELARITRKSEEIYDMIKTNNDPIQLVKDSLTANYLAGNIPKERFELVMKNEKLVERLTEIYKTITPPVTPDKIKRAILEGRKAIDEALEG